MKPIVYLLLLPAAVLGMWMISGQACAAGIEAGTAVVDITPPLGYRMSGYFHERLSTAVHDPLLAKAIVFCQGDRQAAMVFCDLIGETLAATVKAELARLEDVKRPSLAVRSQIVHAPLQQHSDEEVAWATEAMEQVAASTVPFLERVKAYKIMALQLREGRTLPMTVQVFRMGEDLAIVGLPGEVFVDLGLAIKQASPFARTLVIELAHDAPGYVPTRKAFAEGSYETVNSRIQPGGGEMLVDAAVRLLNELKTADVGQ